MVALVAAYFGYAEWSDRQRLARNRTIVDSVFQQKRVFVPGEIVDLNARGGKARILSCGPGLDGMQGDCMVQDLSSNGEPEPSAPYKLGWSLLSIHENEYRLAQGLPFISGKRSDAELAPMLASWKGSAGAPASAPAAASASAAAGAAAPATAAAEGAGPAPAQSSGGGLRPGEYACYGSGQTVLAGLGFKVDAGGNYTDLDGGSRGTVTVSGGDVIFNGGHLGTYKGRDLKNGRSFTIARMVSCDLWG